MWTDESHQGWNIPFLNLNLLNITAVQLGKPYEVHQLKRYRVSYKFYICREQVPELNGVHKNDLEETK